MGALTSLAYPVIVALTLYEIASRALFAAPTVWTLETCLILAGVQYALSGAQAMERDAHIRIDAFHRLFPPWLQRLCDVLALAVALVFLSVLFWWGWEQAETAYFWRRDRLILESSGSAWNPPLPAIHKTVLPIAALLMLLQALVLFARAVHRLVRTASAAREAR